MHPVFTIGHSTRSIDEFIGLLQQSSVEQLIDVRHRLDDVFHLDLADRVADLALAGRAGRAGDHHLVQRERLGGEHEVRGGRLIGGHGDRHLLAREADHLRADGLGPHRHVGDHELAVGIGEAAAGRSDDGDRRPGDGTLRLVENPAADRAGRLGGGRNRYEYEERQHQCGNPDALRADRERHFPSPGWSLWCAMERDRSGLEVVDPPVERGNAVRLPGRTAQGRMRRIPPGRCRSGRTRGCRRDRSGQRPRPRGANHPVVAANSGNRVRRSAATAAPDACSSR